MDRRQPPAHDHDTLDSRQVGENTPVAKGMSSTTRQRDALIDRLFQATLGTWDLLAVYLGDKLGL
jgi:hypothetical protein